MRLNLHDFSGHPFQVELARELAGRGHEVVHTYSTQYVTGHGRLALTEDDPDTLQVHGLASHRPMVKYSPLGRARFELGYAAAWRDWLDRTRFDLVIACNVPLLALSRMQDYFLQRQLPWVLWHQDLYSLGVSAEAGRRMPKRVARLVSSRAQALEIAQVRQAAAVVAITDAMLDQYRRWGSTTPTSPCCRTGPPSTTSSPDTARTPGRGHRACPTRRCG